MKYGKLLSIPNLLNFPPTRIASVGRLENVISYRLDMGTW